jgi:hypothetical protein
MPAQYGIFVFATLACLCGPLHADEPKIFALRLEGGRLVEAPKILRVKRGDEVKILWTTDRRVTIHLHGYDIQTAPDPSHPQTMSFRARATGRFPIETHATGDPQAHHRVLIYLEVHPR